MLFHDMRTIKKHFFLLFLTICFAYNYLQASITNKLINFFNNEFEGHENGLNYLFDSIGKSPFNDNLYYVIYHNDRDIWTDLMLFEIKTNKIIPLTNLFSESAGCIPHAFWRKVDKNDFLITYETTHKGNGTINIYKFNNLQYRNIFTTHAFDSHHEGSLYITNTKTGIKIPFLPGIDEITNTNNINVLEISEYFQNSKLDFYFIEFNNDSTKDLLLKGTLIVRTSIDEIEKINKYDIKRVFYWNVGKGTFIENKNQRIGPAEYFKYIKNLYKE